MNTAFSFLIILLVAGLVVGGQSPMPDCPREFVGTWEYRQAAGDGLDAEGERLELSCGGASLSGHYLGLEREGEHGLFYTAVEVTGLAVGSAGRISFVVPERELFHTRPPSVAAARQKRLESAGITRDALHFEGALEGKKLILGCTAQGGACPDATMVFRR
jgi:hypothetical protein